MYTLLVTREVSVPEQKSMVFPAELDQGKPVRILQGTLRKLRVEHSPWSS